MLDFVCIIIQNGEILLCSFRIYNSNIFFFSCRITLPSMEKATKASRDLLRHCRLVYRRTSTSATNAVSTDELQNLKQITGHWCKSQLLFVDDVWRRLAPWTSLLEPVFALKKFHSSPSYMQNTLSNEWVSFFEFLCFQQFRFFFLFYNNY